MGHGFCVWPSKSSWTDHGDVRLITSCRNTIVPLLASHTNKRHVPTTCAALGSLSLSYLCHSLRWTFGSQCWHRRQHQALPSGSGAPAHLEASAGRLIQEPPQDPSAVAGLDPAGPGRSHGTRPAADLLVLILSIDSHGGCSVERLAAVMCPVLWIQRDGTHALGSAIPRVFVHRLLA